MGGPFVKKRDFYTHLTPAIRVNPSEFRNAVSFRAFSDDCATMCLDILTQYQSVTDRQTDGHADILRVRAVETITYNSLKQDNFWCFQVPKCRT